MLPRGLYVDEKYEVSELKYRLLKLFATKLRESHESIYDICHTKVLPIRDDVKFLVTIFYSRNYTLVDQTRKCAYRAIRHYWTDYEQLLYVYYERTNAYNLHLTIPFQDNKVRGIAKSIAKLTHSNALKIL